MASICSLSLPIPNIIRATSLPATPTTTTLSTPDSLDEKFGHKGTKFSESNSVPFVELTVRNGSPLRLRNPDAHVTSYKPKVYWKDDSLEEILYMVPAGGTDSTKSKGGIGLVINDATEKSSKGLLLSGYDWTAKDADNDAIDALQVELKQCCWNFRYQLCHFPLSPKHCNGSHCKEQWPQRCEFNQCHTLYSTVYHPKTDGQTKRVNQFLEQYLRGLCFLKPK
ncbi:photosynthetic NDH subunit of subcomplex B 2, chloroplastic-like [Hibiscus syriacus]|uniref:photosynthetic NDH subunit of subcomplex B 2, chloroplastic-like n=1 Tax=Hibiscus syriacus TaxID=106335 RepID=UPI0019214A7F|nr:photosynthetic NDH subunit of subcomplex B 2, chloroplastic-like [Hibiscus syriacus]